MGRDLVGPCLPASTFGITQRANWRIYKVKRYGELNWHPYYRAAIGRIECFALAVEQLKKTFRVSMICCIPPGPEKRWKGRRALNNHPNCSLYAVLLKATQAGQKKCVKPIQRSDLAGKLSCVLPPKSRFTVMLTKILRCSCNDMFSLSYGTFRTM